MNRICLLAIVVVVSAATNAWSQTTPTQSEERARRRSSRWYRPSNQQFVPSPYAYGYSSYGGGYGGVGDNERGYADIIRARGDALRAASEAAINIEDARNRYIDNRIKWTMAYENWLAFKRVEREAYWAKERASRDRYLAQKRREKHERLTPSQFDAATGQINWPDTLLDDKFVTYRKTLEEYFVLRAYSGTSLQLSENIREQTTAMRAKLKQYLHDMPAYRYISARKFIDLLQYEGQLPGSS